jgi:hypothetical protein
LAHVRWSIPIGVREHTIELDHGFWSGKRVIRVDGQVVAQGRRFLDFGSTQTFLVDGHSCAVHIVTSTWPTRYLLSVDGKIVAGSPNARLQPKTQALVLFVFALGLAVGAGALMILAPSRIPDSTALRQIDGTIEARKISSDQYSRTLYLTLLGTTQRLKHDSSDAHYRRVEAAIRTGDSISAWVDGRLVVTSDPLEIRQLSRGREIIVPYQDQVAARSISNTFLRILGVIALIGALFTLAASVRRWQESDRATTVGHDRGGEAPCMPTTSTSLLPIRIPRSDSSR